MLLLMAIVGHIAQASPFCPNIAATPDGKQVWFTLKDTKVRFMHLMRKPPFSILKTMDTGPITNHVNFASTPKRSIRFRNHRGLECGEGISHR